MGYWEDRQSAMYRAGEMQVNKYYQKLEKAFNQTRRGLQKTIESFYWRYAEENGLSYAAAQIRMDKEELGELRDFVELAMRNIGKYNQVVNNMSIKARITRYQALEAEIDAMLRQLYAVDYESAAGQTMKAVYGEAYYRTWYNIDQYRGFHSAFAQVVPGAVEKLLEYPFNGANFSSRLWKQKDHLQAQLMEALTSMMVQGKNPQVLAADFAKKMNAKKFDAYRLLHTESSFLMSEAAHAAYKEDGVEKYQILATLDSKTCGICGDKDGEVYEVGKEVTGENMPPFHCFCRCTDVPYYDDMDLSDMSRVARDPETGKTYEVPADMTYREWRQEFTRETSLPRLSGQKTQYVFTKDRGLEKAVAYRNKDGVIFIYPQNYDRKLQKISPEKAMRVFEKVPKGIAQNIDTISFVDYPNPEDEYWEQVYGMKGFVSYATGGRGGITFYANGGTTNSGLTILETYLHEGGHILDDGYREKYGIALSSSEKYIKAASLDMVSNGRKFISDYAEDSQSYAEDFADFIMGYFINKSYYTIIAPNRAKLIGEVLQL